MKIIIVTLFLIVSLSYAQILTKTLSKETSPYLLQHANNPVNWMPWSEKAFLKAKKENKPIFLSIGYSTCHWCHVIEKKSFMNKKIAALLNRYFICIIVDREEMPQIDIFYQNIYKKYKGYKGGWPLDIVMTPAKKVFYITTYIPPSRRSYAEGFDTLLPKLATLYQDKKALKKEIYRIAHTTQHPSRHHKAETNALSPTSLTEALQKEYDKIYIGFGRGKKFPEASKLSLILQLSELTHDKTLRKEYFDMLDVMALRGLYDHAGGGFFRYTSDAAWEIPHFEKMLYNQAELIPLYARAYALSHKRLYKDVVIETAAMVEKRFAKNALYYSASDADSDGEEGGFFIYTTKEIKKALKNNPHASEIEDAMEFSIDGNFHDKVHINFFTSKRPAGFAAFKKELLKIRKNRCYPFIDKKINTAWNAMMIEALYKISFIDKKYAKRADEHLQALTKMMYRKGSLYHQTVFGHQAKQKALLEDYSFFIAALIASYEVEYDAKKLRFAQYLLSQAKEKFYRKGVWYLSDDKLNIKADLNDKYYTSPQSKMLQNIINLSALKASFTYENLARKSLKRLHKALEKKEADAPALATAYLMQYFGVVVLKSSRENLQNNAKQINAATYPYLLMEAKDYDDYLACTLRRCFVKDKTLQNVLYQINSFKK